MLEKSVSLIKGETYCSLGEGHNKKIECSPCERGQYAEEKETCRLCPKGFMGHKRASSCTPCDDSSSRLCGYLPGSLSSGATRKSTIVGERQHEPNASSFAPTVSETY